LQLLLDTGGRLGEILNVKIKDVHLEGQLPYIEFSKSKTEPRPVYLMDSMHDVREWLQQHPNRKPDSYLFVPVATETTKYAFWREDNAHQALRRLAKRAGLKKKIWPHLFRHTSSTLERKLGMPDQLMNIRYGWSENSRMAARYSHITPQDVANFQLKARGVKVEDANPRAPIECKRCKQANSWNLDYCGFCAYPLKDHLLQDAKAQEMQKERERAQIITRIERLEGERARRFKGRIARKTAH
jgi:hypothetical protein